MATVRAVYGGSNRLADFATLRAVDPLLRLPRDVSVHLFRRTPQGPRFLMLRRIPPRGGFWQGVTGAPLAGEDDRDAAVREVREETGFGVADVLTACGEEYSYALRPELADRWLDVYGPEVGSITVATFGADVTGFGDPALDPTEHDAFTWCTYEEAAALLDWPVETDALEGRRKALTALWLRLTG